MMRTSTKTPLAALCAVALLAVPAAPALAATPDGASPDAAASAEAPTVQVGGLSVALDPETGRIRPLTPAEQKKLAAAMQRQFGVKAHDTVEHADGMLSKVLGTEFLSFSVARLAEDGTLHAECTSGQESAMEFLAGQVPATPLTATVEPASEQPKER